MRWVQVGQLRLVEKLPARSAARVREGGCENTASRVIGSTALLRWARACARLELRDFGAPARVFVRTTRPSRNCCQTSRYAARPRCAQGRRRARAMSPQRAAAAGRRPSRGGDELRRRIAGSRLRSNWAPRNSPGARCKILAAPSRRDSPCCPAPSGSFA